MLLVIEVLEHRVTVLDLGFTDHPQLQRFFHQATGLPGVDLRLQLVTLQGDRLIAAIDFQEFCPVTLASQLIEPRLSHACTDRVALVTRDEGSNILVADMLQIAAHLPEFQVGIERVILELF